MAKRNGFLSTTIRMAKAIEASKRRERNAAIREHNAQIRQNQRLQREHEKALRQAEKDRLREEKEDSIEYALNKTLESEEVRKSYTSILVESNRSGIEFSFESLKKNDKYQINEPKKPKYLEYPAIIDVNKYKPQSGLFDKLFKKSRQRKIDKCNDDYEKALSSWNKEIIKIDNHNDNLKNEYRKKINNWHVEKTKFYSEQEEFNKEIDEQIKLFDSNDKSMVEFYFYSIIEQIDIPSELISNCINFYDKNSKILIIDFELPEKDTIPNLKTMKYVSTRKEFSETYLKEKEIDQIYNESVIQICLRVMNDVYYSDKNNKINSIVFNGMYNGVNKSTGIDETKCVLTIQTKKEDFQALNLNNVDAKSCFLKFKGIAGSKLSEFIL